MRISCLVMLVVALGCDRKSPDREKPDSGSVEHRDEPKHDELPSQIHLDPSVIEDAHIRMEPATMGVLARTLALTGEISTNPNKTARVAPPVAGRIVEVRVLAGDSVQAGDVLATLRVADVARVRGDRAAAATRAETAASNASRLELLGAKGLASTQEITAARNEANAAAAEARALSEQVHVLGGDSAGAGSDIVVRAPISGVVLSRAASPGQPIAITDSIVELADLSEVWFLARVFEKDLSRIVVNAPADITLNAYPDRHFQGVVDYVAQQIDPVARTIVARLRVTNTDNALRVGLFGVARIAVTSGPSREPTLLVSRNAITEIGKKSVVFVRQADGDFEKHEVTLGDSALGMTEVVQGLREGENVVVDGVFTLKSIVLKSALADED